MNWDCQEGFLKEMILKGSLNDDTEAVMSRTKQFSQGPEAETNFMCSKDKRETRAAGTWEVREPGSQERD